MDYFTSEEISQKLRVDITTVRRWLAAGALPSIRVGRQYRVEHAAFETFLREREVNKNTKASDLVRQH